MSDSYRQWKHHVITEPTHGLWLQMTARRRCMTLDLTAEIRQSKLHVQVQPVSRAENQLLGGRCTHQALKTAGHMHHRQTHSMLTPTASSCSSLQPGVGAPKTWAKPHCQYRPSHRAGLGYPGPPISNFSLACRDTQAHIHISPLTLQSLQQLARTPWWPQQIAPPGSWRQIQAHAPALSLSTHLPAIPARSSPAATWSLTHPYLFQYYNTDKHMIPNLISGANIWFYSLHEMSPVASTQASSPGSKPNCWHPNLHMFQLLAPWTHGLSDPQSDWSC